MKSVLVTDEMYDQLVDLSIEQDEYLEVMTCAYLEIGIQELMAAQVLGGYMKDLVDKLMDIINELFPAPQPIRIPIKKEKPWERKR